MKVSDLRNDTKKLKIIYKGLEKDHEINIVYRWRAIPVGWHNDIMKLKEPEQLQKQMEDLLVSWDLEDDDGEVLPFDYQKLKEAGMTSWLLASILGEVMRDQLLEPEQKND